MIVWALAFLGLFWVWYMESETHAKRAERRDINMMADDSRRKQTYLARFEQRKPEPSRSARWTNCRMCRQMQKPLRRRTAG